MPVNSNHKERIKDFFADSRKGFAMVWGIAPRIAAANILLFVLQPVFSLLSLYVLKNLIDVVVEARSISWQLSGTYLIQFAALQLAAAIVGQMGAYYQLVQQQLVADKIAGQVLQKAVELDIEYYENPGFYDELHMAQQQSLHRPAMLVSSLQGIVQGIISITMLSGFLMLVHWSLILLVILLGVPMAAGKLVNSYRQYIKDKQYAPLSRKAFDYFQYLTTDAYAKEVRIFDFGRRFINRFLAIRDTIYKGKIQLQKKFAVQTIAIQLFEIIATTAIYAVMIAGAVTGIITIGALVIYFQVFQRLQTAIAGFFQSAVSFFQNQLYLRQIMDYLSTPEVIKESQNPAPFPALSQGIQVKGLGFTYPGTDTPVLANVNMNIRPGTVIAIAGENGAGKSTLIKLLCRLYNATEGSIEIDGDNIGNIEKAALRKNISVIFQDFGKYYLSVEDNIALNEDGDKQRLEQASVNAGLQRRVQAMPEGYATMLGRTYKNGVQLSGGQWQKLALARGLYKQSKILILDEPTSAMDPVAEYEVFENLKKDIGDKIIIIITHRLYNLKMADDIYLVKDGTVAEHGTFDEMLSAKGLFWEMYSKQAV